MADAMATTELLSIILQNEENEDKASCLINLGIKESLLPHHWSVDKIHGLPDKCGVYYFLDQSGTPIYVGKSINIKTRVATHFSNKTEKARKLQNHAHDLTYELTGSELIALILESHEIKRLDPPVNRAQRLKSFPIAIHTFYKEGYLCFDIARVNKKTRSQYNILAEYPKLGGAKGHLTRFMEKFELCPQLCGLEKGKGPCFNYHIRICAGACADFEPPEEYNQRAEEVKNLLSTVFEEDFIVLDEGRTSEELSAIFIKSGACIGYSYVNTEELERGLDLETDCQFRIQSTPEMVKIVRRYLDKKPRLRRIEIK